jgi:hypothetical protein
MISQPHSHHPDSGSKFHFVIAVIIAAAIAIGLTSTAAQAGLIPASEAISASLAAEAGDVPDASFDSVASEAPVPAEQTAPRYLEEEAEFAPKFQHIAPRTRASHRLTLNTLACSLSIAQHCAPTTRL